MALVPPRVLDQHFVLVELFPHLDESGTVTLDASVPLSFLAGINVGILAIAILSCMITLELSRPFACCRSTSKCYLIDKEG